MNCIQILSTGYYFALVNYPNSYLSHHNMLKRSLTGIFLPNYAQIQSNRYHNMFHYSLTDILFLYYSQTPCNRYPSSHNYS